MCGVRVVLEGYWRGASGMLQWCYMAFLEILQRRYRVIKGVLKGCSLYGLLQGLLQRCTISLAGVLKGSVLFLVIQG